MIRMMTYSTNNAVGFPKYREFTTIEDVKDYIEQSCVVGYM